MHNYRIKYLGHAGFSIETNKELFLIDPWLSPRGAFLSSWFQFPCNHHLLYKLRRFFFSIIDMQTIPSTYLYNFANSFP